MLNVFQNGSRSLTVKGKTIDGFNAFVFATANVPNVSIVDQIDLSKIIISAVLHRNGKSVTILSGATAKLLQKAFGFFSNTFNSSVRVLRPASTNDKEVVIQKVDLDFGRIFNLSGGDELVLQIDVQNAFGTSVDTSGSYFSVEPNYVTGVELGIPVFDIRSISSQDSEFSVDAGNDVEEVLFINLDKNSNLLDDRVLTQVSFSSDLISYTKNINQLFIERMEQFNTESIALERNQSFSLYSGLEVDKVNFKLYLDSTKVNGGMNYVFVRRHKVNAKAIELHEIKTQIHAHENAIKKGFKVNTEKLQHLKVAKVARKKLV